MSYEWSKLISAFQLERCSELYDFPQVPDEKSGGGGMDILTIEKKQKEGAYCGSKGWEAIKSDIQSLTRQAFRCRCVS